MASIKFLLQSESNNAQIYIRLSLSKSLSLKKKTGFGINPKDWNTPDKDNPKKGDNFPKQNNPENKLLFNNLKKLESFIFENLNSDLGKSVVIDSFWLESKIKECFNRVEKTDEGLITNYIQDIIDNADTRKVKIKGGFKHGISLSRKNSFIATKQMLVEYEKKTKKKIHFIDITQAFIDGFEYWLLKTKKYAVNTASKHIANIKTVCNEAEKKGIQVNSYAKQIIVVSESDDDRYIQTLSFDELDKIRKADITSEAFQNARKWLLIGCEIGQRGGDLLNITKDNFRYKDGKIYLDLIQQKTKKPITIRICSPYIIDLLKNNFPYKISTQKLNDHIKKVCEIAEINQMTEGKIFDAETGRKEFKSYEKYKLITTHSFRRSFCTNYYKLMPTPYLMKVSGHSKESIFRVYINAPEDMDEDADTFGKYYDDIHKQREARQKEAKQEPKPQFAVIKNGTDE